MSLKSTLKKSVEIALFNRIIWKQRNYNGDCVHLTFDDGPHPDHTDQVLDILDAYNIQATFFILGEMAQKHPDIVERTYNDGHQIGNHGFSHLVPPRIGRREYLREIERTDQILNSILRTKQRFIVRPPYGYLGYLCTSCLLLKKFKLVMWSRDGEDSYVDSHLDLIHKFNRFELSPGDILLFHDDYELTLNSLPRLIELITDNGYSIQPLNV